MDVEISGSKQFYRYTTLGNSVFQDSLHEKSMKYYVESGKCTHIIVVGHINCKAVKWILDDPMNSESIAFLKSELQQMLADNHTKYMKADLRELLVIELSLIRLCKSLLKHAFIHERFRRNKLKVTGIILNPLGVNRKIFYNGIAHNDLISIN